MKNLKTPGVVGGPVELHLIEKDITDVAEENSENAENEEESGEEDKQNLRGRNPYKYSVRS